MAETRTYIEFYFPGVPSDKTSVKEVKSRDSKDVSVPDGAFGFRFFDLMSTNEGGVKMVSDKLNISPMHYYGGRITTLDEVRRVMLDAYTLISNMEDNRYARYARIIQCRTGNFKPFEDGDIYIIT